LLIRFFVDRTELTLKQPVNPANLLFFTKLDTIAGQATILLSVLTGRIVTALNSTFISKAFVTLEEQFLPLAAALPAFCV
jgi:hypothetical protein